MSDMWLTGFDAPSLHTMYVDKHISVQVKASRSGSWQFGDISRYCEISFKGKRQMVGRPKRCPVRSLVVVFVLIGATGAHKYYILTWPMLRDILVKYHKAYLAKHGGMRPKQHKSLHCAILEKSLKRHHNQWSIIEENLR
jgi:hypothetical protein